MNARIRRNAEGTYDIHLPKRERELISSLIPQLRDLLTAAPDDPSLKRFFPPAYGTDEARTEEYWSLMRDDLVSGRLATLDTIEETINATNVTEERLTGWMGAINDIRLVLGTKLDITEETERRGFGRNNPQTGALAVYNYLTWLLGQIVEALADRDR